MNLYTDQQMRNAIKMARNGARSEDNIIDSLNFIKPYIELPSDEEIKIKSDEFELNSKVSLGMHISFEHGAKWMRDKIQGGNNEQR